jgi:Ser/Thr protein kinase RdoA (MazF antagonist)
MFCGAPAAPTKNAKAPLTSPAPFDGLLPDVIAAALESLGLHCDGRVLALNSFENRVFRVGLEDAAPVVAKFYRPNRWSDAAIAEEHAFAAELRAAELSVVAPLVVAGATLHRYDGFRFALYPMQGGHAPEPGDKETLIHLGRALGRLHAVGANGAFVHRPRLDVARFGHDPVDFLLDNDWLPPELEENFATLTEALLDKVDTVFARTASVATLRLHGDCHPGNLLWRDGTAHFVDLDDALTGPAIQDLWMLLSGDANARGAQLGWLLEGYEVFRPFDRAELALVEPLRALRLLHYHAWIARRWDDPAFPVAFPWFASPRHWEGVVAQVQEQLAAMDEPVIRLP